MGTGATGVSGDKEVGGTRPVSLPCPPRGPAIPGLAACHSNVLLLAHRCAMTGIAEWLASIGLGEYAERFRENAIDLSVVRDLTEQDLTRLIHESAVFDPN